MRVVSSLTALEFAVLRETASSGTGYAPFERFVGVLGGESDCATVSCDTPISKAKAASVKIGFFIEGPCITGCNSRYRCGRDVSRLRPVVQLWHTRKLL